MYSSSDQSKPESDKTRFYKLSYTGKYSEHFQKSCQKPAYNSAKMLILKLFLLLLKLTTISQPEIKQPSFWSLPCYKFVFGRSNSCYIGKTCHNFETTTDKHVKKDKKIYYIYIHSHDNEESFSNFNSDYLAILDYSQTQFQVIIKESMYIYWEKANFNKRLNHFVATLSI